MNHNLYLDVHVIQSVPPSNLNRDDAGSPKQAVYGGVRRLRVSSQAWKRATRVHFAAQQPIGDRATRTASLHAMLVARLMDRGFQADLAESITDALLAPLKITPGRRADESSYLLFFGRQQLDKVADVAAARRAELETLPSDDLKDALVDVDLAGALGHGHPVDVALFGRMVADLASLNVDASVQVAHALSTHGVSTEFDYFTAIDDEKNDDKQREDAGAAMIGTVEFTSATLYRYATVGLVQLLNNLDGDVEATMHGLRLFLDSFVRSMPTGHQNSFAHRTRPAFVSVVLREDQPVNLVSAFEKPVHSTSGYVAPSVRRLADTFANEQGLWADAPRAVFASYDGTSDDLSAVRDVFGDPMAFPALLDASVAQVRAVMAE